jgi:RHS repeat-associated protein
VQQQNAEGDREVSSSEEGSFSQSTPTITLPKGGGAIRGIGEKFAANPVTGTGSMSVPIATSPGRSGFGPQLSLSYNSGSGNSPFGFGWDLSLPSITRKTDKGLPQYLDGYSNNQDSDIFILSGAEDLVPVYRKDEDGEWIRDAQGNLVIHEDEIDGYRVRRYRPRIEGLFARIERWTRITDTTDVHWRSISKDNILTIYGKDSNSRIADPESPTRIFSWLICETRDDKGNGVLYRYKAEDGSGVKLNRVSERNRGALDDIRRTANRYLKRIFYGNRATLLDDTGQRPRFLTETQVQNAGWMFEALFDYGEHDADAPVPNDSGEWNYRDDPFSIYRSGFEVRATRLCQRVLMFHHFPDEEGVRENCLVRSTDFTYSHEQEPKSSRNPVYTFLRAVTQTGHKRNNGGYLSRSLPPVQFEYTQPIVQDKVEEIDPSSLENLPIGVDGTTYQWTDLHGEGIPGILTEQADAWYYKRNISPIATNKQQPVEFSPLERVARKPNTTLASGAQIMDLAGDGQPDLVMFDGSTPGLYEHDGKEGWQPFSPFTSRLNRTTQDPNLKFVDLDGDGHADVLITEDDAFVWHASLAEAGFGPARRVHQVLDEEKGPRLVFADGTQSIYLSDLSGDGLTDLVRIRNGEVCYWPNLGYARFGAKVTMDNSPHFDNPDQFDHKRIRLADIDGTGTTDIIYLHRDGVRLYFNQSGNSWSEPQALKVFPRVDDLVSIVPADLLGNGTACLVWSSPLPGDTRRPMRYVNLMGGQKPHLLVKTVNNLGAETHVQYAPSTKFYLQDKYAGKPWITKLPFPVHVVEKVTVTDEWRKTTFSTSYSYHHGYFDGDEREFRGFGRVEQVDVEDYGTFIVGNASSPYITDDKTLYQPPIKTVTWYHTGVMINRQNILSQFKHEYFPNWFEEIKSDEDVLGKFREAELPEPDLNPANLDAEEFREAMRACKGMVLRQEIYELDVDALGQGKHQPVKLFSSAYHNCHIRRLQPREQNLHAVFLVTESEAITYQYELDLQLDKLTPDPRIAHTLNLNIDEYGNVLQSVAIVYHRLGQHEDETLEEIDGQPLQKIREVQGKMHVAYTETRYTKDLPDLDNPDPERDFDNYRLRVPCEVLTYDVTGLREKNTNDPAVRNITGDFYFTLNELRKFVLSDYYDIKPADSSGEIKLVGSDDYHEVSSKEGPQKRLVEHVRMLFFNDADRRNPDFLKKPLPFGEQGYLGLPYETYKLALTTNLLDAVFGDKLTAEVQNELDNAAKSGYLSGADLIERFADKDTGKASTGQYWVRSGIAGFADDAADHFFLPERYTDPFANVTTLKYDPLDLFIYSSTDPLGNTTQITGFESDKKLLSGFDYRVLATREIEDINGNLSEVRFDVLGLPAATAVKGKGDEADSFSGFNNDLIDLDLATRIDFFEQTFSQAEAQRLLGKATARHVYDFGEQLEVDGTITYGHRHAGAAAILRERHVAQPGVGESPLQVAFEYSDGGGNVLVSKVQSEPETRGGSLRWIANGKTILNNKGKPVKQYEPCFTDSHKFEELLEVGVTPIMYYDSAGRLIRTELPDGTFSRVEFTPWHVTSFDPNDTVLEPGNSWYAQRTISTASEQNQRAAQLAAEHSDTPSTVILDSLGRGVISIAHNRIKDESGTIRNEKYATFTKLDAEGKPLWIRDARGNLVMQYITPQKPTRWEGQQNEDIPPDSVPCYDIAGNLLFQHSMDGGDRWMINDAAGQPFYAWDFNNRITQDGDEIEEHRIFHTIYDALRRPLQQQLNINNAAEWQTTERFDYGDKEGLFSSRSPDEIPEAQERNLRGQIYQHYDPSGLMTNQYFDFKGNLLKVERQLATFSTESVIHWPENPDPSSLDEVYTQNTEYDALNRMARMENWHRADRPPAIYTPQYNERGILASETLAVSGKVTEAVLNIEYDAKGQRTRIQFGNGTTTRYHYDTQTFRLVQLRTTRTSPGDPLPMLASNLSNPNVLQNLYYTYDPVGNITEILDDAYEPVFFKNQEVKPRNRYTYDALYRLIEAEGRENFNALNAPKAGRLPEVPEKTFPVTDKTLRNYTQHYRYDSVGNIEQMRHVADQGDWTRHYTYAEDSNRLLRTRVGKRESEAVHYDYDTHGSMLNFNRTPDEYRLRWDYRDMIHHVNREGGGLVWYNYDADKQRTRKRIEHNGNTVEERLYLGGMERYRRWVGGSLVEEIETHHLFVDDQRVLIVEDVLKTDNARLPAGVLFRYQYSNHLGSVGLELDGNAAVISYEEYHPYGTTAYQAKNSEVRAVAKRYRYTGMERDEETGLSYHTARYYLPWLGRWGSVDPIGIGDGLNLYHYVNNDPINYIDLGGKQSVRMTEAELQNLSYYDVQRAIVVGGGTPGFSYENPTAEQRQAEISKLRNILSHHNIYDDTPDPIRIVEDQTIVLMADSHGGGYVGPRYIVERQIADANAGYQYAVGEKVRGNIGGAIGYAVDGERGADLGTAVGGLLFSAGGAARARQTNQAISRMPPPVQGVTISAPAAQATTTSARTTSTRTTTPSRTDSLTISLESGSGQGAGGRLLRSSGLTPSESRVITSVRVNQFNLPPTPTSTKKTLVGVLVLPSGERIPIRSGAIEGGGPYGGTQRGGIPRGRGEAFTGGGPSQSNIATHVEGHAAAIMHQRGITSATLAIEKEPCSICYRDLPTALPPGSRLSVIGPHSTTHFWSNQNSR